jgi:hypothetical protein
MKRLVVALIIGIVAGYAVRPIIPASWLTSPFSCAAPSGAMNSIGYREMFVGKLHDLKFSCIPMLHNPCGLHFCIEFTAIDEQDKHVIGYVWRDTFNHPEARTCSLDGGKSGSFYGECPVGVPVATVYSCPWCEPNFTASADTRGSK